MAQAPKSASKKPRTGKAKVSSGNKTNIKASEENNENISLSSTEPNTTLELTPSNLSTPPINLNNDGITSSNEEEVKKLALIDFNSSVDTTLQDKSANASHLQTPPDFAGFIVPSGCGNVLKAEREAQGLSLSDVCKALRLSINQIQAIEKDDFTNLPKQSIVRGFIRNYARLLKIDAEPILRAFQNIVPNEAPLSLSVKSTGNESVIGAKEIKFTPKIIFNLFLTIAVFVALSYLYTHYIKPKSQANSSLNLSADEIQKSSPDMMALPLPASKATTPAQTSNPVPEQASNQLPSTAPEANESNNFSPSTNASSSTNQPSLTADASDTTKLLNNSQAMVKQASASDSETSSLMSTTNVTASKPSANTTALSSSTSPNPTRKEIDSLLDFKLSAESWIRVESADGKTIFSQLLPAGTHQAINAKPPFNIIIGNAGATKISIDNQEYDLAPITRANVARVQIK